MKVTKHSCADLNCQNKSVADVGSRLVVNGLEIRSQTKSQSREYRFEVKVPTPLNRLRIVQTWLMNHLLLFSQHHKRVI